MTDNAYPLDPGKILLIHASAVRTDDGALIFLGPSGAGKSTICRLLSAFVQPLADDIVYLVAQMRGEWVIVDASNHNGLLSETEAAALEGIPLRAIFRLYQASEARLERVNALETCCHLMDALFEARLYRQYNVEIKKMAFSRLAAIARAVPGYQFYFDRSSQTLETLHEEVGLWQDQTGARLICKA